MDTMPDSKSPGKRVRTPRIPKRERIRLSELSPNDLPWDESGDRAQTTREWMSGGDEWQQKKAENMESCGRWLLFAIKKQGKHVLQDARFCRTRLCPRCQWRRACAWKARWANAWPELQKLYPKARFFHMVLSAPTIPAKELKERLARMTKAWNRMTNRKGWPALGFVRSTEVTICAEGKVNPHFHCLVMVKPTYFTKHYVSAEKWLDIWASAMEMDVTLDFKGKKPYLRAVQENNLENAVKEMFKYAVKNVGLKGAAEIDDEWIKTFLEVDRQLKGTQAQALGGMIREAFRGQDEITEEEMLGLTDEPDEETIAYWEYLWNAKERYYARSRVLDEDETKFIQTKEDEREKRKGALKKPIPDEIRASPAMKDDWDLNKIGLQLNAEEHVSKKTKKARAAKAKKEL